MLIATYNVNSIKARLEFVLGWLAARQPDVVCLQELKVSDEHFPREPLARAGYHAYVHGQKTYNGVAVLGRAPGELVQLGLPGVTEAGARLVTVRFEELTVTSVYVPNGKTVAHPDFALKLRWLERLAAHLRTAPDRTAPAVVGGDFNVAHGDLDSHAPEQYAGELCHTDAERAALDAVLATGLSDLYREHEPTGRAYSWWDYRGGAFARNQGLRIDLLLGTAPIRDRVIRVYTDRELRKKQGAQTPSDHAPVMAELSC